MIKIAFFDIDGTLFDNASQKWNKKSLEGIKEAQKRGIKCVLCSARPYHSMKRLGVFNQGVDFDGWIGSCGAITCYNGEILRKTGIKEDTVKRFVKMCKEDGYTAEIVGVYERSLLAPQTKESEHFYSSYKESIPPVRDYNGEFVVTFDFFCPKGAEEKYQKAFPELVIFRYFETACDCMEVFHHKSDGMKAILDKLGLTKDEVIAFGDDLQDIDMLECASAFVCMGQGKEEVKKIATYVAKPVSEDGVYHGLKHYGLVGDENE